MTTMNATVKDVMTNQVVAVRRDATFKEMAATLRRYRVSAFPVVDDHEKVIGVVSEADLLAKDALADPGVLDGLLHHKEARKAEGLTAGDLMTHPAVTVRPDDSVEHAARLMYALRIKRLPVVNAGGDLVGLVARSDLLAVYDRSDEEIRTEVLDRVIVREFLEDPRQFSVTVTDGVVTLQGSPETTALGRNIVRKVRHVAGVVAVRDHLSYPDDYPAPVAGPMF
jgi:CBS domain-containing protein